MAEVAYPVQTRTAVVLPDMNAAVRWRTWPTSPKSSARGATLNGAGPDQAVTPVTTSIRQPISKRFARAWRHCCTRAMPDRSSSGRSRGARRYCSSPISTSALERLHDRHSARRNAGVGFRRAARWAYAGQIRKAKVLLWKGHCSVHQMFQAQHVLSFRSRYPDGLVISHPSAISRLQTFGLRRSTDFIIKTITESKRIRAGWSAPS